jgi:hypothetical protein
MRSLWDRRKKETASSILEIKFMPTNKKLFQMVQAKQGDIFTAGPVERETRDSVSRGFYGSCFQDIFPR